MYEIWSWYVYLAADKQISYERRVSSSPVLSVVWM